MPVDKWKKENNRAKYGPTRYIKKKRRPPKASKLKKKQSVLSICRDCGLKQTILKVHYYHHTVPRCIGCGGMLEKNYQKNLKPSRTKPVPTFFKKLDDEYNKALNASIKIR